MSPEETIAKAVEQRADRIVATLCDIVRFPSIVRSDPRENGGSAKEALDKVKADATPLPLADKSGRFLA
jgi:hypothetical protein